MLETGEFEMGHVGSRTFQKKPQPSIEGEDKNQKVRYTVFIGFPKKKYPLIIEFWILDNLLYVKLYIA